MGSGLPRRVVTSALIARLNEVGNVTVYLRRVGYVLGSVVEVPPPTVSDTDRRVRPYVVVHPSPGTPGPDQRLDSSSVGRVYGPQITCVVGDEVALDVLVDAVTDRLDGWRPVFAAPYASVDVGRFRSLRGFDPGPGRRDDDVTPARFWTPLQYRLPVYA